MAMGWSPRKNMAMGNTGMDKGMSVGKDYHTSSMDGAGDFGVSTTVGGVTPMTHMDRDHKPTPMDDGMRGASNPIPHPDGRKMHNQANPDHGPHHANKGRTW
jgi:hypothetical protein